MRRVGNCYVVGLNGIEKDLEQETGRRGVITFLRLVSSRNDRGEFRVGDFGEYSVAWSFCWYLSFGFEAFLGS